MPAVQLRIATVGNVDAGKSTLTGCLTRDILDDGRGHARAAVLRCKHEQETGRTSSVGTEVMVSGPVLPVPLAGYCGRLLRGEKGLLGLQWPTSRQRRLLVASQSFTALHCTCQPCVYICTLAGIQG